MTADPDPDPPGFQDGNSERWVALVYDELRGIAQRAMRGERRDHTLQPTALVHEVWLRLAGEMRAEGWDRERFVAHAVRTARRALVDHARLHATERRGAGARRVTLEDLWGSENPDPADLVALHEALEALAERADRQARVVELRWFGGLSFPEIGRALGVSDRTAKNDWRVARAWLARWLSE